MAQTVTPNLRKALAPFFYKRGETVPGGGGGVTSWLGLSDTPSTYTSQSGYMPVVNAGESALEFNANGLHVDPTTGLLTLADGVLLPNADALSWKDTGGTTRDMLTLNSSNDFLVGFTTVGWGDDLLLYSGDVIAFYGDGAGGSFTQLGYMQYTSGLSNFVLGVSGAHRGLLNIQGNATGSYLGAELRLATADDHDTTVAYWSWQAYGETLRLLANSGSVALYFSATGSAFFEASVYNAEYLYMLNNKAVYWKDSGGTYRSSINLDTGNTILFGHIDAGWGDDLILSAGDIISLRTNGASGSFFTAMTIQTSGTVRFFDDIRLENNKTFNIRDSGGTERVSYYMNTGDNVYIGMGTSGWGNSLYLRAGTSTFVQVDGASGTFINAIKADADGITKLQLPYIHVEKTTTQSCGGSNLTETYMTWQTQTHIDTSYYTHDTVTNSERIYVDEAGRYEIKATVGVTQDGGARTTMALRVRVNGTTKVLRGGLRNYSRGSGYGDMSCHLNTELDLSAGDYVEVYTWIDDTDATYTNNTINAECEVIMRKLSYD